MRADKFIAIVPAVVAGMFALLPVTANAASVLCTTPGVAYCNGEVNGTIEGWTITANSSFNVSDSFVLGSDTTVSSVLFGAFLGEGDTLNTVDWTILSGGPDTTAGGTVLFSGASAAVTSVQDLGTALTPGFDIQVESFNVNQFLAAGTYYLELGNAVTTQGEGAYWDENDGVGASAGGPSIAWQTGTGFITNANTQGICAVQSGYCSESFAVIGTASSPTPEPSSVALTGGGLVLLLGTLRRRKKSSTIQ